MKEIKRVLVPGFKKYTCKNNECKRVIESAKKFTEENKLDCVCNNGRCAFMARDQAKYNLLGFK